MLKRTQAVLICGCLSLLQTAIVQGQPLRPAPGKQFVAEGLKDKGFAAKGIDCGPCMPTPPDVPPRTLPPAPNPKQGGLIGITAPRPPVAPLTPKEKSDRFLGIAEGRSLGRQ